MNEQRKHGLCAGDPGRWGVNGAVKVEGRTYALGGLARSALVKIARDDANRCATSASAVHELTRRSLIELGLACTTRSGLLVLTGDGRAVATALDGAPS